MAAYQHKAKSEKSPSEICIIFSRYPEPGTSKTRLIPHLGERGAATLQRRMTEKVVAEAEMLAAERHVHLELAVCGGESRQLKEWLGQDRAWRRQQGADLGQRLRFACDHAFARGFQRLVLVGADCPQLTSAILAQAFQGLQTADLVVGPTQDGGYYLIGLRRPLPTLFESISWGSDQVLDQTLAAARQSGLATALLPQLVDVDRPEDLTILPEGWR